MTYFGGARFVFFRPASLWMRSLAGSCSLVLSFYALTHCQSLSAVLVLANMFPVWVALLSWPMLGTAPKLDAWIAIAAGVAGVVLIQNPADAHFDPALVAAALGSLTTSIAMLGLHRLHHLDPRSIVAHFSAVSVLFCLAALVLLPREPAGVSAEAQQTMIAPLAAHDPRTFALLLGVGISATIGQLFLTKAFAAGPPAKVSVVGLSQVGISALVDTLFFHRTFTLHMLAGMALVIAPTIWLLLRSRAPAADEPIPPPVE
jgi:drug/metabolite transporter (DMT)-like permease